MKTFSIIDGSWFLFRAWYAFPPLNGSQGQNQNVIYGFIRMMLKLLLEQPEYFVIAWDSPVKTKRHEQYSDYKAHRKKLEDEFRQQIPQVLALVEELGIPNIVAPWYEADDTIATLVKAHQGNSDLLIQVFSSDKDLKQFLCENVVITDSSKNQMTRLGDFEREFGFAPSSIVDYLALLGDSADNIKGVAWIGEKKSLRTHQDLWNDREYLCSHWWDQTWYKRQTPCGKSRCVFFPKVWFSWWKSLIWKISL